MVVVLVTVVVIDYWHVHYDYAMVLEWYVYVYEFNWLLLLLVEMVLMSDCNRLLIVHVCTWWWCNGTWIIYTCDGNNVKCTV